jgi:molybdopterin-containing oxidoreductase family iron-sulfur binding subunit
MPASTPKTDDRPWMELDGSLSRPARREGPEREEPAGLLDGAASLDRRSFLAVAGLSVSLAACERLPVRHALPYLVPPEEITPGVSARYASTCLACPAACGLVATVRDGRPIKLEGHPEHPLSRGGLCALGQGDLRALYDAGRVRQPTLEGRPAKWGDVDALVLARLEEAKQSGRAVYVLSRTISSPTARAAVGAFLAAWDGRPAEHDRRLPVSWCSGHEIVHGCSLPRRSEIGTADLLVTLGRICWRRPRSRDADRRLGGTSP